jgi:hypothetical protein
LGISGKKLAMAGVPGKNAGVGERRLLFPPFQDFRMGIADSRTYVEHVQGLFSPQKVEYLRRHLLDVEGPLPP